MPKACLDTDVPCNISWFYATQNHDKLLLNTIISLLLIYLSSIMDKSLSLSSRASCDGISSLALFNSQIFIFAFVGPTFMDTQFGSK